MSNLPQTVQKTIGLPIAKHRQKTDKGTLLVRGYFTSDQRDVAGDIITRAATEAAIPRYRQWANVRRMHLPEPVGRVRRIGAEDGLEWNELEIEVIDPKAVFEVENDLLPALSVGILVNMDDVKTLDDGGWVINKYVLAEISLVDHPANYDAYLKSVGQADTQLRMLVRQFGLDPVAASMKAILDREKVMEDELVIKDAVEKEQEVTPEVEQALAVPTDETEAAEPEIAEAPVEDTPKGEVQAEDADPVDPLLAAITALTEKVDAITLALAGAQETLKALTEARVEQVQDEVVESDKALEAEPGTPADRKGAVPETHLPEGEDVKQTSAASDLRKALEAHFNRYAR